MKDSGSPELWVENLVSVLGMPENSFHDETSYQVENLVNVLGMACQQFGMTIKM